MLSASNINGSAVKDPNGEGLGDIKDLMIDLSSGRVAYAVVEFGGLVGSGSKLVAVPVRALRQDAENRCFVMDTTTDAFDEATGFDKERRQCNAPPYWV